MKKIATLFLMIILFLPTQVEGQKFSSQQLRNDFEIFRKSLEETHPGLYRFSDKQWFDSAFNNTAAFIQDSMSLKEFYRLSAPLVARVKCGHTKYFPASGDANIHQFHYFFDTTRLFPLKLIFTEHMVQIVGTYDKQTDRKLQGVGLLSINGKPIQEIKDQLFRVIPTDGNVISAKYLELNKYFSAWYANFISAPDSFLLELQWPDSSISQMFVKPATISNIREHENKVSSLPKPNFGLTFPGEK
ncbi:MAG: hypothetical protein HC831_04945 [Chloroflexia bacterium]|nr:hypothetical protein [Chloroflexia bacterium]